MEELAELFDLTACLETSESSEVIGKTGLGISPRVFASWLKTCGCCEPVSDSDVIF